MILLVLAASLYSLGEHNVWRSSHCINVHKSYLDWQTHMTILEAAESGVLKSGLLHLVCFDDQYQLKVRNY